MYLSGLGPLYLREGMPVSTPTLRQEALSIIEDLNLLGILCRYGRAEVVGSVALDLVVKLDIDVHLLVEATDLLPIIDSIYHQLLDRPRVREVRLSDYRDEGAVKIGIDHCPDASGDWSIDLWVTNRIETTAYDFTARLQRELRPEHRRAILAIKQHYYRLGRLRGGLSRRIYLAVLEGGVRGVDEFEASAYAARVGTCGREGCCSCA